MDTDTGINEVVEEVVEVSDSCKCKSHRFKKLMSIAIAVLFVIEVLLLIFILNTRGYLFSSGTDWDALSESAVYVEAMDESGEFIGEGSAFLIDDGTKLVTCYHVIDGAAKVVAYDSYMEKNVTIDTVLAYDEEADLAILKCEGLDVNPLFVVDSEFAYMGDEVFVLGYPLGMVITISNGIISSYYYSDNGTDTILTTAAISEGSSGSPLLDENGWVIGVIRETYVDAQNMNEATTSNELMELLESCGDGVKMAEMVE